MTQKTLEKNKIYSINYQKANGEQTTRRIIPLNEAPKNIKALDITDLDPIQREFVINTQADYRTYVEQHLAQMFDFETWYEHTAGTPLPADVIKYRTFTVENMQSVSEGI